QTSPLPIAIETVTERVVHGDSAAVDAGSIVHFGGTLIYGHSQERNAGGDVHGVVIRVRQIDRVVGGGTLKVGEQPRVDRPFAAAGGIGGAVSVGGHRKGERRVNVQIVVQRQPDLFEVIFALRAASGFSGLLHRRQQQSDEDRDDGDHHEQFDQCETAAIGRDSTHE